VKSRRKSWNSTINSLLLLTSIAAISFMGVSYAIFTNNVEITTSISTAKIILYFAVNIILKISMETATLL